MRLANRDQYLKCLDAFLEDSRKAADMGILDGSVRLEALIRDRKLLDGHANLDSPSKAQRRLDALEDVERAVRDLRTKLASLV